MTSANRSGLPLATSWSEVYHQFGDELDGIVDHTRPIVNACDDSLVHLAGGSIRVLRMARGFAPLSLQTAYAGQPMIGVGAQQKATIALAIPGQWLSLSYWGYR
ncbi:Sua5/YciO/YrdC/YwlC family protein [Vibrio sp. PP-XX7]